MFTRAAKYINKGLSYPSNLLAAIAMVAMVFSTLMVVADTLMGWIFNSPIAGAADLGILAFSMMVWGAIAVAAFKGSHIALTFVLDKLPRLPRLCLQLIIALVSSGMLGVLSWALVMHGIDLGEKLRQTGALHIPYEPFLYVAAFACAVAALVFLARVPETVGKIRKEQ